MGKSEILMLLAGVALSIMLAMIAVPMFSSGNEMADRQQVQQDLMSIRSSIPLILALEGNEYSGTPSVGKFTHDNIKKHVTGFDIDGENGPLINTKNKGTSKKTTYTIKDEKAAVVDGKNSISVAIDSTTSDVDLSKLSRMENICDLNPKTGAGSVKTLSEGPKATTFTCIMSR